MGWSDTEELICVQDDALVFVYDMFGHERESYSMNKEANSTKVGFYKFVIRILYVTNFYPDCGSQNLSVLNGYWNCSNDDHRKSILKIETCQGF